MLKNFLQNSAFLVFCIALSSISYGADKIDQNVSENAIGVVHTGKGDVHIGITLEQYEKGLKEREKEVKERFDKAHNNEKKILQEQLDGFKRNLVDKENSYKEHIKDLRARIDQLESIRGEVSDSVLEEAKNALANGNTIKAEKLFVEIEKQAEKQIKAAAEAKYQRCKIAADNFIYRDAFPLCERAVQLSPENTLYLNQAGLLAISLGQYDKAIEFHTKALTISREIGDRQGEGGHLGNLGLAYDSLGQYDKAIEFHTKALAIAREIGDRQGEGSDLGNLGLAYDSLGQYDKAIEFHTKALTISREIGDRQEEGSRLGNLGKEAV